MSRSPLTLRLERLAFSHASDAPIFDDLTLHLGPGWTGVVGANGVGKSTLLQLVVGALRPDRGQVLVRPAGAVVTLCPQRVEGLDDAIAALASAHDATAGGVRARLELDPAALARWPTLSPGERKRWQIGAALAREPDLLLLDEPTNHLDADARDLLLAALARFAGVGLVVSHDRELLDGLCHATVHLAGDGGARVYDGPWSVAAAQVEAEARAVRERAAALSAAAHKARRQVSAARQRSRSAERGRSTRARRRNAGDNEAGSMGAKIRADRAASRASRDLEVRLGTLARAEAARAELEVRPDYTGALFVRWEAPRQRRLAGLELAALTAGDKVLARDVAVEVRRDTRAHLVGPNGAGKTTLLAALARACPLPEDRILWLPQELTRADEAALLARARALDPEARGRLLALLARLGVEPRQALSGAACSPGEARKLVLAEGLARAVWLVVLDEPTNHLDLPSIARVQEALASYPGALVTTSHDAAFARALTRTTWRLEGERLVVEASP